MKDHQKTTKIDFRFMKIAISLGYRNLGATWPNPSVGCVIVKNNHIIGVGNTAHKGRPHAEKIALEQAKSNATDSTVYLTLEPCSHFGKTNPCASELIKAKVKRVVCPLNDPDPRVNGKGFELLKKNGIEVDNSPLLLKELKDLNEGFITSIKKKRPHITLKLAVSLNGKIATKENKSSWISGKKSRIFVQMIRSKHDAILIGSKTAFWDNPRLNLRDQFKNLPQPTKIILDKNLKLLERIDLNRSITNNKLFLVHDIKLKKKKTESLKVKGINTLGVSTLENGYLDLIDLFKKLSKLGLTRVLVEGGGKLATSLIEGKLVDKLILFSAGIILDKDGIDGINLDFSDTISLDDYDRYSLDKSTIIGNDIAHFWNIKN